MAAGRGGQRVANLYAPRKQRDESQDKGKEKDKPGYTIQDEHGIFRLSFDRTVYLKANEKGRSKLREDADKLVDELAKKIWLHHTKIFFSLYLDGLPIDDQIYLQKKLMGVIENNLKDSNTHLTHLALLGWKIIGTPDEIKQNRTPKELHEQRDRVLRSLGVTLSNNTKLTSLLLFDCGFTKTNFNTFFIRLDRLKIESPNTETSLKAITINGDFKPQEKTELKELATQRYIGLEFYVPPKPKAENNISRAAVAKIITKPKSKNPAAEAEATGQPKKSAKKIPTSILDLNDEQLLLLANNDVDAIKITEDEESSSEETKEELQPIKIEPVLPERNWQTYALYAGAGIFGGTMFGMSIGGIVSVLGVFAEYLVGNAVLFSVFGIGITTFGIGLIVAGTIFAGLIIGGFAYGIYQAEQKYQADVQNAYQLAEDLDKAPLSSANQALTLAPLLVPESNPAAASSLETVPLIDQSESLSIQSSPGRHGHFSGTASSSGVEPVEEVVLMDLDTSKGSSAPSLGYKPEEPK